MNNHNNDHNTALNNEQEEDFFVDILRTKFGREFLVNPDNDSDFEPFIIVDTAEPQEIEDELQQLGAQTVRTPLETGDYLVSSQVAVERKRGDDFYSSLTSGSQDSNLFQQLIRLQDAFEIPILLVEDFTLMFRRGGTKMVASLYGAMVAIATQLKIPLLPTRDTKDTAMTLYRMAKQQQIRSDVPTIPRRAPKSMSIKERQVFFMEGLINVGPKKASTLIQEFKSPFNVVKALVDTNILYTRTGNPKGINGKLSKIKGFGWKFVRDNKKLLQTEKDEST